MRFSIQSCCTSCQGSFESYQTYTDPFKRKATTRKLTYSEIVCEYGSICQPDHTFWPGNIDWCSEIPTMKHVIPNQGQPDLNRVSKYGLAAGVCIQKPCYSNGRRNLGSWWLSKKCRVVLNITNDETCLSIFGSNWLKLSQQTLTKKSSFVFVGREM